MDNEQRLIKYLITADVLVVQLLYNLGISVRPVDLAWFNIV